jgi:hypothetical protein
MVIDAELGRERITVRSLQLQSEGTETRTDPEPDQTDGEIKKKNASLSPNSTDNANFVKYP